MAGDIAKIGFEANTDPLKRAKTDLENLSPAAAKAETAFGKLSRKVSEVGSAISGKLSSALGVLKGTLAGLVAGLLASLGIDRIIHAFGDLAEKLDSIGKASDKLHESMGNMQGLAAAADLAGIDMGQLSSVAQRMNRTLGEAIAKGKGTQGVFKALGISAKELASMPLNERLATIADRIQELNPSAEQMALILAKLGDRSGALSALLQNGGDDIRNATQMIKDFGGAITDDDQHNIQEMNDSFTKLGYSVQAVGNQILATVAPAITVIITSLAYLISYIHTAFSGLYSVLSFTFKLIWNIANALFIQPIINGAKMIDKAFQAVFGTDIVTVAKFAANAIINAFKGAFAATQVVWERLPVVFRAAAYGAAKLALDGVNAFVQGAINAFSFLATKVAKLFNIAVPSLDAKDVFDITGTDLYKDINAKQQGASADLNSMWKEAQSAFSAQMSVDNFASANDKSATAVKTNKLAIDALSDSLGASGDKAKKASEKLTELQQISKELDAISAPYDQATSAFQKLSDMQKNGIINGDQYAAMLMRIHDAFIAAGGTAEQWSKIISTNTNTMGEAIKDFATNSLTSLGDAFADLAITGKIDFKSLADSIIRDLIRIAWQAIVVKPLLSFFGLGSTIAGGVTAAAGAPAMSAGVVAAASSPVSSQKMPAGSLVANGGSPRGAVGGGLHIEKVEVSVQGNGSQSADDDREQGKRIADSLHERFKAIAVQTYGEMNAYGGAANPRGIR